MSDQQRGNGASGDDNGASGDEQQAQRQREAASHAGPGKSAGGLRGRKGANWDGGIRVPGIFHWPGTIPAGGQLGGEGRRYLRRRG